MLPITGMQWVTYPDDAPYVILDRIVTEFLKPAYCVHGRTQCVGCRQWVWLGNNSEKAALARRVRPLCQVCALTVHLGAGMRVVEVNDHLRKDGPHE